VLRRGRPADQTLSEPLVGWRTWRIRGSKRGDDARLFPIAGSDDAWPAREPVRAKCGKHRLHRVPGERCTCGIHGVYDVELLRRTRDPAALGTLAAWGRIVEHERGFRAALGYPQRLGLVCSHCFWRKGATGSMGCDVVVRHRDGQMVPLCQEHLDTAVRSGYRARRLLDPTIVERALLDSYAVDLLRWPSASRPEPAPFDPVH
jgi:hypothetical protein